MLTESYVFLFGGLWNLGAGGPGAPGAPGWAYLKTRIVITCGEQAFPTSYFKKVHESCSLCLSPPQRPLCVVGRLVRKKKRVRGGRWEGEERREAFSLLPAGASAEEREPVRRRLGSWNESERNWKIEGGRGRGREETSLSSPTSFLFFALVPTFSTYYQWAASRRGGSIIKPCAKVSRQNEFRSDVT